MKVLNLFAGLGGNRKLWGNVEVVAVELDQRIAEIYQDHFPGDKVVVGDAHQYLLDHYKEFDFIWTSPPCQTHSTFRQNFQVKVRGVSPIYPDMRLYEEIIFLKHNTQSRWVVENVKPYYAPLIPPQTELQRHLFWSNFHIGQATFRKSNLRKEQIPELQERLGFDLGKYKVKGKRQVLRNCVSPEIGLHVFNAGIGQQSRRKQLDLFVEEAK
jgi:DNA (cytosine-5)-methyltransferase 1